VNGKDHPNATAQPRASLRSSVASPASTDDLARAISGRINTSAEHSKIALCKPRRINSCKTPRPQHPVESIDPRNRGWGYFVCPNSYPVCGCGGRLTNSPAAGDRGPGSGSTATLGSAPWHLLVFPNQPLTRTGKIACATKGSQPEAPYCTAHVDTVRPGDIYEARPSRSGLCSAGLQPGILPAGWEFAHTRMSRGAHIKTEPQRLKPRKGAGLMSELKLRPPKGYVDPQRPKTCRANRSVPLGARARRYT
jgi:hypothetical protein